MLLSYVRTILLYLVLIAAIRLMGKRQVGQMEPSEFVVTILVANLASIPMEDGGVPLHTGIVPILTVLGLELILSGLVLRSVKLRRLLCGKPVILIDNGRIRQNNLRRTRITLDELTGQLREKDILEVSTVQYAILETNGNISVFPYPKEQPAPAKEAGVEVKRRYLPVTVIGDGYLYRENLALLGKDENWVRKVLREKDATLQDTWLLTVDQGARVYFVKKEAAP